MAAITRELQFTGRVMSTPAAATILINGIELYSGQVGVGQAIDTECVLAIVNYTGQDNTLDTISISISVTSGVTKIGTVNEDTQSGAWVSPGGAGNDGRTQILINGLPPDWPATPIDPMPGGTEQDPDWSGWCFEVSAGETINFECSILPYTYSV